jgi:hypothetical protein
MMKSMLAEYTQHLKASSVRVLQVVGRKREASAQLRVKCTILVAIRDTEVSRP